MAQRPQDGQHAAVGLERLSFRGQFLRVRDSPDGWVGTFMSSGGELVEIPESMVRTISLEAPTELPQTIIRTYGGLQQADVLADLEKDARLLGRIGYEPTSQSWAVGQWGCGHWLAALALCLVLVGILVFFYMLIVHPEGTLTVTFTRREAAATPAPQVPSATANVPTLRQRLAQLEEAKAAGLVTDEEYATRRSKILDET